MSFVFGSSGPLHEGSPHQGVACLGDAGVGARGPRIVFRFLLLVFSLVYACKWGMWRSSLFYLRSSEDSVVRVFSWDLRKVLGPRWSEGKGFHSVQHGFRFTPGLSKYECSATGSGQVFIILLLKNQHGLPLRQEGMFKWIDFLISIYKPINYCQLCAIRSHVLIFIYFIEYYNFIYCIFKNIIH